MKPTKEVKKALDEWAKKEELGYSNWQDWKKVMDESASRNVYPVNTIKEVEDLVQHIWDTAYKKGKKDVLPQFIKDVKRNSEINCKIQAKEIFKAMERYGGMSCSDSECRGAWGICDSNWQKLKTKYKVK